MDHIQRFTRQFRDNLTVLLLLNNAFIFIDWWVVNETLHLTGYWAPIAFLIVPAISMAMLPKVLAPYLVQPMALIWQAIVHIAPDTPNTPAPDLKSSHLGKEIVAYLVSHIYQLASVAEKVEKISDTKSGDLSSSFVANSIPLPLVILDKNKSIVFANEAMLSYIKLPVNEVVGKSVYSVLDIAFSNEHTFDVWLKEAEANKAVDTQSWERVRLNLPDEKITRMFDMAAYYNKNNPQNFETMVVFFDHTDQYSQDDQAMSFVAIAVHELRTPLTLLRGYIEAFEEELEGTASPEMANFMEKMSAAAQQLATFVNNILNVARIENDQLTLELREAKWPEILESSVNDMRLRAGVRGIKLELQIDDNMPTVAIDQVSIYEVIGNLVDNAIKYSGESKKIIIHSYVTKDGLVETTIQDFGVGIPESGVPNLFEKFYRNHRSEARVGGTGLGLYLSKTIVNAHSGHIWARSKEGQGSVFGFSLVPYSQIDSSRKNPDNGDITRGAHGWIKNHSMYRR
jgi:signal transduction histidine kinase